MTPAQRTHKKRIRPGLVSAWLGGVLDTAEAIRATAERLDHEASNHWTPRSTESFSLLSERLVSGLLPHLAATESVLAAHLDADVRNALKDAHHEIRQLAERMAIVSEAMSRSPQSRRGPANAALVALSAALERVEISVKALGSLETSLSDQELAQLAQSLATASAEARSHLVFVTQPEAAATDAYVLRRRPDLDRAYATNLAEMEKGAARPRRPTT